MGFEHELGNYAEAERLFTEALDAHRRVAHHWGIAVVLNELCLLRLSQGRPEAALPLAHEALAVAATSMRHSVPYSHRNLARTYYELNDLRTAESHARLALEATRLGGDRAIEPSCHVQLAEIAWRLGDHAAALRELQTAARLASEMRSPRVQLLIAMSHRAMVRRSAPA